MGTNTHLGCSTGQFGLMQTSAWGSCRAQRARHAACAQLIGQATWTAAADAGAENAAYIPVAQLLCCLWGKFGATTCAPAMTAISLLVWLGRISGASIICTLCRPCSTGVCGISTMLQGSIAVTNTTMPMNHRQHCLGVVWLSFESKHGCACRQCVMPRQ